jgi:hypothetical protein
MMASEAHIEARAKAFLAGRPREYADEDPRKLQHQLNGLADMLVLVVKERDRFILAAQAAAHAKLWARVLTAAVIAEGCVIGFLAEQLFARLR